MREARVMALETWGMPGSGSNDEVHEEVHEGAIKHAAGHRLVNQNGELAPERVSERFPSQGS
jgi:hypothetical protein